MLYDRIIALILVKTVPSTDIKGHKLVSTFDIPMRDNINAITILLYSYKYSASFSVICSFKIGIFIV